MGHRCNQKVPGLAQQRTSKGSALELFWVTLKALLVTATVRPGPGLRQSSGRSFVFPTIVLPSVSGIPENIFGRPAGLWKTLRAKLSK